MKKAYFILIIFFFFLGCKEEKPTEPKECKCTDFEIFKDLGSQTGTLQTSFREDIPKSYDIELDTVLYINITKALVVCRDSTFLAQVNSQGLINGSRVKFSSWVIMDNCKKTKTSYLNTIRVREIEKLTVADE